MVRSRKNIRIEITITKKIIRILKLNDAFAHHSFIIFCIRIFFENYFVRSRSSCELFLIPLKGKTRDEKNAQVEAG